MSIPVNYNISPREKQLFQQCLFGRTHKIKERILKAFDFGFIGNNQDDPHKFIRGEGTEKKFFLSVSSFADAERLFEFGKFFKPPFSIFPSENFVGGYFQHVTQFNDRLAIRFVDSIYPL